MYMGFGYRKIYVILQAFSKDKRMRHVSVLTSSAPRDHRRARFFSVRALHALRHNFEDFVINSFEA